MKQFVLALAALCLAFGCKEADKGYTIKGSIADATDGPVYLKQFRNKMFFDVDTAELVNGQFEFKGTVDQPLLYGVATADMKYPALFFLENAPVELTVDGNQVEIADSPINDLFLGNSAKVFEPGFNIDSLVANNPESAAAAFYLYRYFTYQLTLDELKAVRAKISPKLDNSPYVQDVDGIIAQLENVQLGKVAPEFTLPDTTGQPVSLSDFRGQYVLIDFWASWCPPCRRENPNVVKAYNENKDNNFTIIGISLDNNKENWLKGIQQDSLTWTHLSDLKYWDSEIPALYGVRGIPANILIGPDGVIIAQNIMDEELHETLKKVLPAKK